MSGLDLNRREFLKVAAGTGAALALPTLGSAAASSKMIGIQVGAISFVDEGTEKVLDVLQERGGVNTLFLAVFTYGRGIAGRQIPGQPLPDHGQRHPLPVGRDSVGSVVTGLTNRLDFLSVAVNHHQAGIRACISALVRDNAIKGT